MLRDADSLQYCDRGSGNSDCSQNGSLVLDNELLGGGDDLHDSSFRSELSFTIALVICASSTTILIVLKN